MGPMRRGAFVVALAGMLAFPALAHAQDDDEPQTRQMTQQEIEAWLDARNMPGSKDVGAVEEPPEAPPPPPRKQGLVVEGSVGALGHLGSMKNISPTAPWFHLQLGFEPLSWLMAFGEVDAAFATTSYANPPPEPRGYAFYSFGGGVRITVRPTERVGIYAQGSLGLGRISEDVLHVYGYEDADTFNLYFGGQLGVEWYQVNPHYALALHGGVKNYEGIFGRTGGGQTALAWTGGVAIRYAF